MKIYREAKTNTGKPLSECEGEFELVVPIEITEEEVRDILEQHLDDEDGSIDIISASEAILSKLKGDE